MNEDNNNQNDQPKEEQQTSDETQAEYREISDEELKQVLEDHKKWLESDGKEGEPADFRKANLSDANLKNAELSKANFEKAELNNANLKHASLREANFRKANCGKSNLKYAKLNDANLQKVNLDGAILQKANFFKANLQKADLSNAHLQKAFLNRANLKKAELYKAELHKATLLRANLQKAILSDSKLHKADLGKANIQKTELDGIKGLNEAKNLQYSDFQGATGLLGNEFAQADVTGTKLPDDIKEFKSLETVKETSQNARKIFFAMLLGCVYSWLTIATTTDVRLLTNTASSPLPIIGTEIPIAWFYIAAPLVLICLYFYFHLYLDNLWKSLAGLPAIFPDGKPLDQTAYPWLLNSLVCRHFERLKKRSKIAHLKEWITIFLAWWVVPITMIAFWLRYIPRHDWVGTIFHIGLIIVSSLFAIIFYRLCALTLQGKEILSFKVQNFWSDRRFYYGISVVVVGIIFSILSYGAIEGYRLRDIDSNSLQHFIPLAFDKIGYNVFVDFKEKELSEKPDNYWQLSENQQPNSVIGVYLRYANLNNADMSKAFLVKADLRDALLCSANLSDANLQKADLTDAILRGADLKRANLNHVNFENADLSEADLIESKFFMDKICEAKTIYKSKLELEAVEALKKRCSHLFEKPKDE